MNIFVDIDEVVADLLPAWVNRYNAIFGDSLNAANITGWSLEPYVKPECGKQVYQLLEDPTLYDEVEPILGSLAAINVLRERGHRIIFATASPNGSAGRKLRWLYEHEFLQPAGLPTSVHPDYIEVYDKSLLSGDVLIDDGPHNVSAFRGLSILFRQPHNEHVYHLLPANNWAEVLDILSQDPLPIGTHPTELKRPHQTRAFRETVEEMYRVHLDKNADYSPANILGTGEIGLMTRTWDKIARLMNLMGFKIEISSMTYTQPQSPKNESIDDSLLDGANYLVIWSLLRKKVWGR